MSHPPRMSPGWYPPPEPDPTRPGMEQYWDGSTWLPSWRPASERSIDRATRYTKVMNWLLLGALALVALGYLLSKLGS